jgi:hypothetical protein
MARLRLAVPFNSALRLEKPKRRRTDAALAAPPSDFDPDGLRPSRGIINGLLVAGVFWIAVGWEAWLIFR